MPPCRKPRGCSRASASARWVVRGVDGSLKGILSERDIVHAVAEASVAALAQSVSQHMTASIETCSETDSVDDLMELMTRRRFRHVPVVDGEQLAGIVSIGDIVKTRIAETEQEASALRQYIAAS
ncbi:MAG: CBS domain-containing protein [Rhizomicrobium sp.]